jgi:hypothetical protein
MPIILGHLTGRRSQFSDNRASSGRNFPVRQYGVNVNRRYSKNNSFMLRALWLAEPVLSDNFEKGTVHRRNDNILVQQLAHN